MALREGQKCLVADIDFCKAKSRDEAEADLRMQIPDLILSWLFFENDFHACQANISRRASPSIEDNLRALRDYHAMYKIPTGTQGDPGLETRRMITSFVSKNSGSASPGELAFEFLEFRIGMWRARNIGRR